MAYKKLWSCMHDNPHHDQVKLIPQWYKHMRKLYDFWPIAYYPYGMLDTDSGLKIEGIIPEKDVQSDWELVKHYVQQANDEGYPMFAGYEWQGSGLDGDHNVFFLNNDEPLKSPLRYTELRDAYLGHEAIAIPHHVAYHLGDRGKNWSTHDEVFSPFAELYSSHGCSESDDSPIPMTTHIHMGPRVHNTSYEAGLNKGYKVGCIASGDNHAVPGMFANGSMCVLTTGNSKEEIWEGLKKSRVYGVRFGRMDIDFDLDGHPIGEVMEPNTAARLHMHIIGDDAIDRIEILKDNIVEKVYYHSGTWERQKLHSQVTFKFKAEFGWGPDMRIFPEIHQKEWDVQLKTKGKILSVERCFNSFGQEILAEEPQYFHAHLTSHKASGAGKWMGAATVKNEALVFEITAGLHEEISLIVDGKAYHYTLAQLMESSVLEVYSDAAYELIERKFGHIEFYRNDTWYHNAYKFKLHKAIPEIGYTCNFDCEIDATNCHSLRARVYQKNGAVAWLSPVFVEKTK